MTQRMHTFLNAKTGSERSTLRWRHAWSLDEVATMLNFECARDTHPCNIDYLLDWLQYIGSTTLVYDQAIAAIQTAVQFDHLDLALHILETIAPTKCHYSVNLFAMSLLNTKMESIVLAFLRLPGPATLMDHCKPIHVDVAIDWMVLAVQLRVTGVVAEFETIHRFRPLLFACCYFSPIEDRRLWAGVLDRYQVYMALQAIGRAIFAWPRTHLGFRDYIGTLCSRVWFAPDGDGEAMKYWCTTCNNLKVHHRGSKCCGFVPKVCYGTCCTISSAKSSGWFSSYSTSNPEY
ncbi:Aste57867_877 [Aphanomyces stellatus]|uniref:Aste57867_877 protein n=1 Tax=Aphanomyces stellatus TaxID=120398 RepID=A0A485K708_9STRA|nr:hypothetical protein As57867_000876 [Aphanomyces stellatus]VFT78101.1 Aste57867_877 [Aphanomyces stellatus]